MRNQKPPFEITNAMIGYVAEIAELVGKLTSTDQLSSNPTLRRTKWNPAFSWLPVESMIYAPQPEYYAAINASNDAGESLVFIEFMLSAIKASLIDAINTSDDVSDGAMDKATLRWKQIEKFLETHSFIMNADVRNLCNVSAATANRILAGLAAEGKLVKYREGGHWAYRSDI